MEVITEKPTTKAVPEGYKRTDADVIPEDWELTLLGDDVDLISGRHVMSEHCNTDGHGMPYITGPADFPNGKIEQNKFTNKPSSICKKNDILVTVKGSGAGSIVLADNKYCISRQLMAIRVNDISHRYLYYQLKNNNGKLEQAATGLIPGLSRSDLLELKIPTPTLEEQQAIAKSLSDVDALIAELDALIEKKQQIKKGAMQQLLSGKKRLPGFDGEWEDKKLKDLGNINTGGTPSTMNNSFWNGDYPWVTPTDIGESKNIASTEREITAKGLSKLTKLPSDTLLVTCIASIGKNAILRKEGSCNQQINAITPNEQNEVDFLYYLIELRKNDLLDKAGITATLIISKKNFMELEFAVPELEEQKAIARILSDMDAEIQVLQAKRVKYEKIKQGMMQELLTGKTRLI